MSRQEPAVRWDVDHSTGIARLELDRPARGNALTRADAERMIACLTEADQDDDVRVVVIAGTGPDLTIGWEIEEAWETFREAPGGAVRKVPSQRARLQAIGDLAWGHTGLWSTILHCRKVTILEARGRCYDVGVHLALACDLTIATTDAQFACPRWRALGVDGDISLLVATVGLKRAAEMMHLNGAWGGEQARESGLVDQAVKPEDLTEAVHDVAVACASVMRDGIVTEKYLVFAALEKLGIGFGQAAANVLAGLLSNIHHQPGELNVLRELRERGRDQVLDAIWERFGLATGPST